MEKEPKSLSELEQRESKVANILGQRKLLYHSIGKGNVKPGTTWDADIKIGRARSIVFSSIENYQKKLTLTQEKSEERKEQLITIAQDYESEVFLRETQLEELQKYAQHIPDIFEKRKTEFEELKEKPTTDPELKRGLELLRQQEEEIAEEERELEKLTAEVPVAEIPVEEAPPFEMARLVQPTETETVKEAEKKLPKLVINEKAKEVTIDGKVVKIGEKNVWDVLLRLAQNPNEYISLQSVLTPESGLQRPIFQTIFALRQEIGSETITQIGKTKGTKYSLNAEVEFVKEEAKKEEPFLEIVELLEQEIEVKSAMQAQILNKIKEATEDNFLLLDDLSLHILGESNAQNNRQVLDNIDNLNRFLLKNAGLEIKSAMAIIGNKRKRGFYPGKIEKEDMEVSESPILTAVPETPAVPAIPEAKEEAETKQLLTLEEAMILGALIITRDNTQIELLNGEKFTFKFNDEVIEACKNLVNKTFVENPDECDKFHRTDYTKFRGEILEGIQKFLEENSETISKIIDTQDDEDIKTLLTWFCCQKLDDEDKKEQVVEMIFALLKEEPDEITKVEKSNVEQFIKRTRFPKKSIGNHVTNGGTVIYEKTPPGKKMTEQEQNFEPQQEK